MDRRRLIRSFSRRLASLVSAEVSTGSFAIAARPAALRGREW